MKNAVHLSRDYGWFVGNFDHNQKHQHFALQLSIPLEGKITVKTEETTLETHEPVLIQSNVIHQLESRLPHFLLLMNPASSVGHFWKQLAPSELQTVSELATREMKSVLEKYQNEPTFPKQLNAVINRYSCFCDTHQQSSDDRVNRAIAYLEQHSERIVSLEEIADHCHLSTSRFLHLFKEETGITFRRAQSWNKLINALPDFGKTSFTEIAHKVGFADSAHLSRTFKENFGFSPRDFNKFSQFIQV